MCDLRTTMNEMERRYSFNADTLPERLVRQTLFRANRLLMEGIYRNSGTGFLLQRLRGESMYGTCEILCRELAAKYPADTPLMLVVWSPEEIQALADGMDISLSDHEIRTVWRARRTSRKTSGLSPVFLPAWRWRLSAT